MNRKKLFLMVLAAVIVIGTAGTAFSRHQTSIPPQKLEEIPVDELQALSGLREHGALENITIRGEVIEIFEREFTLRSVFGGHQKISVVVNKEVEISTMYALPEGSPKELIKGGTGSNGRITEVGRRKGNFEEMKKGDVVHIHLTINPDGAQEVIEIEIWPRELF